MKPSLCTLLLLAGAASVSGAPYVAKIKAKAVGDPIGSVQGLISRVLGPQYVSSFTLQVIPVDFTTGNDVFELDAAGGVPIIRGNTGVAIASGLGWYLKYYCNSSWGWGRNGTGNLINLPSPLPVPTATRNVSPARYRYSWNVCTFGYSYAWLSAAQWQDELDRMALWGVNLPLAFVGQEYIWRQLYYSLTLTDRDLWAYFAGGAFLPWNRMGNMQAWGGPLDDAWIDEQHDLQLTILAAMRAFGMTPVLPGFAGHVPAGLKRVFPNASYTQSSDWCGFNATYGSVTLLEPTDPLFLTIGTAFHKMVLAEYGAPGEAPFFNADMYNEMDPNSGNLTYLADCNAATYQAMTDANSNATYVMQAWLFHSGFWNTTRVQAYLSGVPVGGMLILDLNTDAGPVWNQYDSFYGHEWVWNFLGVYGGDRGIYGDLNRLASGPYADRGASATLVGMGITPEAVDEIHPMFDLMFESGWRSAPVNGSAWLQTYAVRRYGQYSPSLSQAYAILETAAYNSGLDSASVEFMPVLVESVNKGTDATGILAALRLFVEAAVDKEIDPSSGPFSYDLTDLNRQVLCNLFVDYHNLLGTAWLRGQANNVNNTAEITSLGATVMSVIAMLDMVNGADVNFLLGTWLADAAQWGFNSSQAANRDYNARNQITLWGPNGEINDYAAKNGWSGLVGTYYGGRWSMFINVLINATVTGQAPDWGQFDADVLNFARAWDANMSQTFPSTPSGASPVALAQQVISTYASGNVTAYTQLANTRLQNAAPAPQWVHMGDNVAAVSNDCPFEADGPGGSVAACEAGCAADASCNVVNWNAGINTCIFRVCLDAAHPQLTPGYDGWSVYANVVPRSIVQQAWHKDAGVLSALCDADPACVGFDSTGILSANASATANAPGVTLYLKPSSQTADAGLPYPSHIQTRVVPPPTYTRRSPRRVTSASALGPDRA